jgi:2-polyprenyl-3-methyl-5-hydroxy-6-metoxy-1,4-benzoquinol methylase
LSKFTPVWHQALDRPGQKCAVCDYEGSFPLLLEIGSIVAADRQVTFATCPQCRSIIQLDFEQPQYESARARPVSLSADIKFYVEQGAGLETLVTPAFIAQHHNVRRYLEIGCGFGFGLDFAKRTFGWNVLGIDPSVIAQEGSRLLGTNIENRYFTAADETVQAYDAIAAIEVLEHIPSPLKLLKDLRCALSPGGILILTTPNAEYIRFGNEDPGFLGVLSPGYHVILYTPRSLETVLQRAGFAEVQVIVRGATLFALAGQGAGAIKVEDAFQPGIYQQYLEHRLATVDPQSILGVGLSYRLFKHLINNGRFPDAEPLQTQIAQVLRRRDGIDILDPHRLLAEIGHPWSFEELTRRLPACLVGLLYFSAMLRLNGHEDRGGAVAYFYATHVMAGIFRNSQEAFGIADGETADLEVQARRHLKLVLDWMTA